MSKLNYTNTYWNNKGKYQEESESLNKKLVPIEGKAKTEHGEVLRNVGNIYHDVYNNGGGNFYQLREQRQNVIKFLKSNGQHIPDFLYGSYDCDCNPYDDAYDGYFYSCECVTDVQLTQQIVDELENMVNFIIEYCLKVESV